jgi:hypothetical protein
MGKVEYVMDGGVQFGRFGWWGLLITPKDQLAAMGLDYSNIRPFLQSVFSILISQSLTYLLHTYHLHVD